MALSVQFYSVPCKRCKGRFTVLGYVKHRCIPVKSAAKKAKKLTAPSE